MSIFSPRYTKYIWAYYAKLRKNVNVLKSQHVFFDFFLLPRCPFEIFSLLWSDYGWGIVSCLLHSVKAACVGLVAALDENTLGCCRPDSNNIKSQWH